MFSTINPWFLDYKQHNTYPNRLKKKLNFNFHLRMSHHLIDRSLRYWQRIDVRFCRRASKLIILSHWSNQIEEKRNEGSTASLFEYDLKWVCGVKSSMLISWDYLYCNFRKLQVVGPKILIKQWRITEYIGAKSG